MTDTVNGSAGKNGHSQRFEAMRPGQGGDNYDLADHQRAHKHDSALRGTCVDARIPGAWSDMHQAHRLGGFVPNPNVDLDRLAECE